MQQKGELISFRPDIKVVDCTIRDGGLVNNFYFDDEFVKDLYKTNAAAGVDYMEFGYKASKDLFDVNEFGKWKFCDEQDIRDIVGDNDTDMKISVMADVGRTDYKKDIIPKKDSVIDMIRIATYVNTIPAAVEMINYCADMGYETTEKVIENLKERVKEARIKEPAACKELIINIIRDQMMVDESAYDFEKKKSVILVIGVNGVGKTTTIGKLAAQYKKSGKKVLIAAADTFRAGAIDQLKEWANRAGVDIIAGQEGSDPAAIVYDAVAAAKARDVDILLCDTAGRLHNKKNLMAELHKIHTIIEKEYPEALLETMIVVDGTTGQNALAQAKEFSEVADVSGVILTKLDGTAKGGIAIAIQSELSIPVKYIGIGEQIGDLQRFDAEEFVNALFEE